MDSSLGGFIGFHVVDLLEGPVDREGKDRGGLATW
jgi:hypothetical protein